MLPMRGQALRVPNEGDMAAGMTGAQKAPPHDHGAERACIGAMLIREEAVAAVFAVGLGAHHFYSPSHQAIADAILTLHVDGQPVDVVLVEAELERKKMLEAAGGRDLLIELSINCPAPGNAAAYATRVIEKWTLRQYQLVGDQIANDAREGLPPAGPLLERLDVLRRPVRGPSRQLFVDWSSFWCQEWNGGDWLLEPIIPSARATHIHAKRATGKSEFMLACGAGLATGRAPLGRGKVDPMPVVVLDTEMGERDLYDRLLSLGYGPGDDLSNLHYAVLPEMAKLHTKAGGDELGQLCETVGARLVVVDSLLGMVEGEENANDLYEQLHQCTMAPLKRAGIASVWLGNTGKDPTKGSRGGSRKEDVMDCVWEMRRGDGGGTQLINTKKRAGWVPDQVDLNRRDDDGTVAYRLVTDSLPPGTLDAIQRLNDAEAPLDLSVRDANRLLKSNGKGVRTEVLSAALRTRRDQLGAS